jgi:hypothetical protein
VSEARFSVPAVAATLPNPITKILMRAALASMSAILLFCSAAREFVADATWDQHYRVLVGPKAFAHDRQPPACGAQGTAAMLGLSGT